MAVPSLSDGNRYWLKTVTGERDWDLPKTFNFRSSGISDSFSLRSDFIKTENGRTGLTAGKGEDVCVFFKVHVLRRHVSDARQKLPLSDDSDPLDHRNPDPLRVSWTTRLNPSSLTVHSYPFGSSSVARKRFSVSHVPNNSPTKRPSEEVTRDQRTPVRGR